MNEKRYVFGYGSILNPASMAKDVNPKNFTKWTVLHGYERIFNAPVDGSLALNIRESEEGSIEGTLILADDEVMAALEKREKGYLAVDVTDKCEDADGSVFAFIADQGEYPDMHILQTYIDECIAGVPQSLREAWMHDSVIQNPIVTSE